MSFRSVCEVFAGLKMSFARPTLYYYYAPLGPRILLWSPPSVPPQGGEDLIPLKK
jgi:hypothetical protein